MSAVLNGLGFTLGGVEKCCNLPSDKETYLLNYPQSDGSGISHFYRRDMVCHDLEHSHCLASYVSAKMILQCNGEIILAKAFTSQTDTY